jgi:hypothetical protein
MAGILIEHGLERKPLIRMSGDDGFDRRGERGEVGP